MDISQVWRGRGTRVIKMGKQRPRERQEGPAHSHTACLPSPGWAFLQVRAIKSTTDLVGLHSVLLDEVDRRCVSGPGCPQGSPDPPLRATWNLPSSSKQKEAKFSHRNGEGGANNLSWHKAASSICLEVEGETGRQTEFLPVLGLASLLADYPAWVRGQSPRILLGFLCLENKRSDHRSKDEEKSLSLEILKNTTA